MKRQQRKRLSSYRICCTWGNHLHCSEQQIKANIVFGCADTGWLTFNRINVARECMDTGWLTHMPTMNH